eukprot:CAMPEP_0184691940 /NCGR_PEP_ID=MMETSP0313-20130426/622_1 /TAXON_ID=2792 /ORGANISM="Porphyridium aerugineum, Strain SAG 1380-2" /LENGTH=299 /DNA_ID=CAMNT_0027149723 /DNA_START=6 /DNA_END=905 /DNA_ORIENTATION=+
MAIESYETGDVDAEVTSVPIQSVPNSDTTARSKELRRPEDCLPHEHISEQDRIDIQQFLDNVNSPDWKKSDSLISKLVLSAGNSTDSTTFEAFWKKDANLNSKSKDLIQTKGTAIIRADLKEVFSQLSNEDMHDTIMNIMDPMHIESIFLEKRDPKHVVMHSKYRSPVPKVIQDRDFVFVYTTTMLEDGRAVCIGNSIDYPTTLSNAKNNNNDKKFVRGLTLGSGFLFEPINDDTSGNQNGTGATSSFKMSYIVQVDPKGWIPTWLVNLVCDEQSLLSKRLESHYNAIHNKTGAAQKQT